MQSKSKLCSIIYHLFQRIFPLVEVECGSSTCLHTYFNQLYAHIRSSLDTSSITCSQVGFNSTRFFRRFSPTKQNQYCRLNSPLAKRDRASADSQFRFGFFGRLFLACVCVCVCDGRMNREM